MELLSLNKIQTEEFQSYDKPHRDREETIFGEEACEFIMILFSCQENQPEGFKVEHVEQMEPETCVTKETFMVLPTEGTSIEKEDVSIKGPENTIIEEQDYIILPPLKKRVQEVLKPKRKHAKKKTKLKKSKIWNNVPCVEMGFNLTLFPRPSKTTEFEGDIDNLLHDIEMEYEQFDKRSDNFDNILKLEGDKSACQQLRSDRHKKIPKAHKAVKTKYCRSITNNKGKQKLYVNHRVLARMSNLKEKSQLYNIPENKPKKSEVDAKPIQMKTAQGNDRWQNTNRAAPVQNLAFALDTSNNPTNYEATMLSQLINLQHRELTPEDYELLSLLDQSVAPKTISKNLLLSFKTEKVGETLFGKLCSVCLEAYDCGQTVKYLPCGHEFHSNCIDMWLSNSSMNCPLDGLSVER